MSTDDLQKSATEYEYEPFEIIFLRRREEILKLVGLAGYALRSLEGSARLTEVLKQPSDAVERAREIEALAHAEVKADLPLLHSAAAILIWGSLEAAFRDFLVRWLVSRPSCLVVPELNNVRVRIAEYESFSGEDRMRFLVGLLERELAATLKPGVGRFACLLKPFGIAPITSEDTRRDLTELAAVRNVIVHCAGIADARLIASCPWLKLNLGDPICVGNAALHRYVAAASEYAAAIIEAARIVAKSAAPIASAAQPSIAADRDPSARGR